MKLTGQEIIDKITEEFETYIFEELEELKEFGTCKMVADEEFTNGEAWRVVYFEDHDVYIRQNGYYNSYESVAEYEEHDYDIVEPYEKTVIDYRKVEEKV